MRRPYPLSFADSPTILALENELRVTDDPETVLDTFWDGRTTPLIEPVNDATSLVTFLWRDGAATAAPTAGTETAAPAEEVLIFMNRVTDERHLSECLMRRIPRSDTWALTLLMENTWRASYNLHPRAAGQPWPWEAGDQRSIRFGLDRGHADPHNPTRYRSASGAAMSIVELPDAPPQPHTLTPLSLLEPDTPRQAPGLVEWVSGTRRVHLQQAVSAARAAPATNAAFAAPAAPAVLVVLDGEIWTGEHRLPETIHVLHQDGLIRDTIVAYVESGGRDARWRDMDDRGGIVDWMVSDLLPHLRTRFGAGIRPEDVIVAGQSLGGYTSLRAVLEYPEAVGGAISQSASLWQKTLEPFADPAPYARTRVYLEVGYREWILHEPNEQFAATLQRSGINVSYHPYNGGHDYACWRGGIVDGILELLATTVKTVVGE